MSCDRLRPLTTCCGVTARRYVGLRNEECDMAISAIELDPTRARGAAGTPPRFDRHAGSAESCACAARTDTQARCLPGCQDTSVAQLPEYPAADYDEPFYSIRQEDICACGATRRRGTARLRKATHHVHLPR